MDVQNGNRPERIQERFFENRGFKVVIDRIWLVWLSELYRVLI